MGTDHCQTCRGETGGHKRVLAPPDRLGSALRDLRHMEADWGGAKVFDPATLAAKIGQTNAATVLGLLDELERVARAEVPRELCPACGGGVVSVFDAAGRPLGTMASRPSDALLAFARRFHETPLPEPLPDGAFRERDRLRAGGPDPSWPFLSEGVLYPLYGKEDARSILAYIRIVFEHAGLVPFWSYGIRF